MSLGPNELIHCNLEVMGILVNIGSGNGLVPDGTKPLPEPVLIQYWEGYEKHIPLHLW